MEHFTVTPYYGHVGLGDQETTDLPEFQTGEEAVVATPGDILVATQDDRAGPVTAELWRQDEEPPLDGLRQVFEGRLVVRGPVAIGNVIAAELWPVDLPPGEFGIEVWVPSSDPIDRVVFRLRN